MQDDTAPCLFDRWTARLEGDAPDHPRFVGAPLGIEGLSPLDLGRLWAPMRRVQQRGDAAGEPAKRAAGELQHQALAAGVQPAFDAESGLEVLRTMEAGAWFDAVHVLQFLSCPPGPDICREVDRVLGPREGWPTTEASDVHLACALARHADAGRLSEFHAHVRGLHAESPHQRAEFESFLQIGMASLLTVRTGVHRGYFWPGASDAPDPAAVLAEEPAYTAFARETLEAALQRLEDIHSGRIAYKADAAFNIADAQVIARAARVAAWRDEPWYGDLIQRLLPLASAAPTAAKTLPSQSLSIALGHSIEGVPTPESVQALRAALSAVKHAGVEKKLSRNLKPAERALAARPEVALRITGDSAKPDKKQQAMVAKCLEAGWWTGLRWSAPQWLRQIAGSPNGRPFATGLVWVADKPDGTGPLSFAMGSAGGAEPAFVGAGSQPVAWDADCVIRLWHPSTAPPAERQAWQAFFAAQKVRQPVRQVFREFYPAAQDEAQSTATQAFAGHELSIRPLIGLARREGWKLGKYTGLMRVFGSVRATFQVSTGLYPGLEGACESMALHFEQVRDGAWRPLAIADVDPAVFSEACRAVDLLVSVTAFAIDDGTSSLPLTVADLGVHSPGGTAPRGAVDHPRVARMRRIDHLSTLPLAGMARMRRETLALVFAPQVSAGRIVFDAHHVRVGDECAVHLATARATRQGEPIDVDAPGTAPRKLVPVPWLPYDEALLQRVAERVCSLLEGEAAG